MSRYSGTIAYLGIRSFGTIHDTQTIISVHIFGTVNWSVLIYSLELIGLHAFFIGFLINQIVMVLPRHTVNTGSRSEKSMASTTSTRTYYIPKGLRSAVSKHFGIPNGKTKENCESTICTTCLDSVPYQTGSTTGMRCHLKRKHGIELASEPQLNKRQVVDMDDSSENCKKLKQVFLKECLSNVKQYPRGSQQEMAITDAIANMIIMDLQPMSIVEDVGFKQLLNVTVPGYEPPSRAHMTS